MGKEKYQNITGKERGGNIFASKKQKEDIVIDAESGNLVNELLAERKKELQDNPLMLLVVINKILSQVKNLLKKGFTPEEIKKSKKISF